MTYLPTPQQTPWQQSHDIDLAHTAVLVIDELGGSGEVMPALKDMLDNSVLLVDAARAAGVPVIFTNDAHISGLDRELDLWGPHGVADSDDARPFDALNVQQGDYTIPKRRYNGFFQTDLDLTLRELDVDTLLVMGADTNICVLQTLAGAYFLGYKTIVAGDACATFLIGTQESGLEYFSRCYDSRVVSTQEALGYLKA